MIGVVDSTLATDMMPTLVIAMEHTVTVTTSITNTPIRLQAIVLAMSVVLVTNQLL